MIICIEYSIIVEFSLSHAYNVRSVISAWFNLCASWQKSHEKVLALYKYLSTRWMSTPKLNVSYASGTHRLKQATSQCSALMMCAEFIWKYGRRGGSGNKLSERTRYLKTYGHDLQSQPTGHTWEGGFLLNMLKSHVTGLIFLNIIFKLA